MIRPPNSPRITLLLACCLSGCGEDAGVPTPVRPVRAIKVGDAAGISDRWFPGRARGTEEVNLSFRVTGEVNSLPINVGDVVSTGDVLATLDARDYEAALERAEAAALQAAAEYDAMQIARPEEIRRLEAEVREAEADHQLAIEEHERHIALFEQNATTQSDLDRRKAARDRTAALLDQTNEDLTIAREGARVEDLNAKRAEMRSLEAEVVFAQNNLEYTSLIAPFDGTIVSKFVDNYQTVAAGQVVCRLLDSSSIEIVVEIPENRISMARFISDIVVTFDAFPEIEIEGATIKEVGTEASELTRTYPVTVLLDQPDPETGVKILPGMAGRVRGTARLPDQIDETGFEVPDAAVFTSDADQQLVWIIDEADMTVHRQQVSPVDLTSLGMRVTGVQQGQWIVTAGVDYLNEGQTVRILGEAGAEDP